MDPSYNQQPISSGTGDIILTPSASAKKSKKPLIIVVICIVIIAIVGLVVWLIMSNKIDIKTLSSDIKSQTNWAGINVQCPQLVLKVADKYTSSKEYEEFANECIESTNKLVESINRLDGYHGDKEFKEKYNNLKNVANTSLVSGDNLTKAVSVYKEWFNWQRFLNSMTIHQTEEDLEKAVQPLQKTGYQELVDYSSTWLEKRKSLINAYTETTLTNDQVAWDNFDILRSDFDAFQAGANGNINIATITGLGDSQKSADFAAALTDLIHYVEENL